MHIADKTQDELASFNFDDSSLLESDYEPLDYSPPPSPTPHSLSASSSTYSEHVTDIPHTNPRKKETRTKVISSIKAALEAANDASHGKPQGLLRFWKKGNQETVKEYWNKVQEDQHDADEKEAFAIKAKQSQRKIVEKREAATLRKQKQRKREKDAEIRSGVRSPGGSKRKVRYYHPITDLTHYNITDHRNGAFRPKPHIKKS